MKFLENVEIGDIVLVRRSNAYGDTSYFKDVVLRTLKTKIVTKTNEFYMKDGESLENTDKNHQTLVELTKEVEEEMLQVTFTDLLRQIGRMKFDNNQNFENFISKIKNLYQANKPIKKGDN